MFSFIKHFSSLFDGDLTEDQRQLIRKAFAAGLTMLIWRAGMIAFAAYSLGALTPVGISGFANAEVVKKQLADVTTGLAKEQAKQGDLLKELSQQLKDRAVRDIATEIRSLVAKRCLEKNPAERDRLLIDIDSKHDEYRSLKGRDYNVRTCTDL